MVQTDISLGPTAGAVLLGMVFATIAFGMTNVQGIDYYRDYPNDWWLFKVSVAILWILDALHVALTVHVVYYYLVDNFGVYLDSIVWSFKVQVVINTIVILLVQTLYAVRFWRLRPSNKLLPALMSISVAAGYVIGIWECVAIYPLNTFHELPSVYNTTIASFSVATYIDIVIACGTIYYLQGHRSKTHFAQTNSTLATLIVYAIASGVSTSACSIATLVTYAIMPTNLIFVSIEFLLTKLYINSFLAMLNARRNTAKKHESVTAMTLTVPSVRCPTLRMSEETEQPNHAVPPYTVRGSVDKDEYVVSELT